MTKVEVLQTFVLIILFCFVSIMDFDWKEKICLVTGAAGGIGLALVKAFLIRGAKCLMTDINFKVKSKLIF